MSHPHSASHNRSTSRARSRSPLSRPTTPLRPSSRSSFRNSQNNGYANATALDALEPQFAELSDSMADLEANFMHLQLMHESLNRFGESFASFLYGLNMNAFVVDFPEQPLVESIKRWQKQQRQRSGAGLGDTSTTMLQSGGHSVTKSENLADTTFMTADTSFASMKATPRRRTMGAPTTPKSGPTTATAPAAATKRSGIPATRGSAASAARGTRGASRGGRASGLPRGRGRGAR